MRSERWGQLLFFAALLLVGCRSNDVQPVEEVPIPPAPSTRGAADSAAPQRATSETVVSDVPLLAHGTHMVYGIRMPRGMMPMKRMDSVHRFEGTHSIESVKKYVVEQLAGVVEVKPNQYGKGYIINNAIPKSSQKDLNHIDTSAKKYTIKIYDGSLGGAGVDIWESSLANADHMASQNHSVAQTLGNIRGKGAAVVKKNPDAPKIKYETRQARERATFDVFEKLSKGLPLTEEDYQSPYFTEQ